jgi:hypothetical protein
MKKFIILAAFLLVTAGIAALAGGAISKKTADASCSRTSAKTECQAAESECTNPCEVLCEPQCCEEDCCIK